MPLKKFDNIKYLLPLIVMSERGARYKNLITDKNQFICPH